MFHGNNSLTIVKVGSSNYVVGTEYDGLFVVDMKRRMSKMHLFHGMIVQGMALVGNGQVLTGIGKWKDYKGVVNCAYHLVDIKSG